MSEKQLNDKATGSPPKSTDPRILSGRDNPQTVVETTEMHWLGAEGGVIYPEGGDYVFPG